MKVGEIIKAFEQLDRNKEVVIFLPESEPRYPAWSDIVCIEDDHVVKIGRTVSYTPHGYTHTSS